MSRQNFQDIIPPEKRSIQKIPIPERRRTLPTEALPNERTLPPNVPLRKAAPIYQEPSYKEPVSHEPQVAYSEHEELAPCRVPPRHGNRTLRIVVTLFVLLVILGAGLWFVSRVSEAKVIVTPKEQPVSVDGQFTAEAGTSPQSGTSSVSATGSLPSSGTRLDPNSGLQFQTITIQKDGQLGIAATGQEMAEIKATGVITIYNTTKTAQKLVANTRFETPKGLIFRISQPITIPGASGGTPGSIDASVTADQVGPDYNVGLSDFTIPGFKGDPRYTEIYARTKTTSPVQGGFSGMRNTVSDANLQTARDKVHTELASNLVNEAKKDIPTGYVLPNNAYYIEYESLQTTDTDTGVQVNERATFHGIIFNREALAEEISKKVGGTETDQSFDMTGIDNLSFALTNPNQKDPWDASALNFTLQGTTTLVSVIDTEKLKAELVGQPRKSLNAILAAYPEVDKAQVTMRPFWQTTFPTNKDDIVISVNNPSVSP